MNTSTNLIGNPLQVWLSTIKIWQLCTVWFIDLVSHFALLMIFPFEPAKKPLGRCQCCQVWKRHQPLDAKTLNPSIPAAPLPARANTPLVPGPLEKREVKHTWCGQDRLGLLSCFKILIKTLRQLWWCDVNVFCPFSCFAIFSTTCLSHLILHPSRQLLSFFPLQIKCPACGFLNPF